MNLHLNEITLLFKKIAEYAPKTGLILLMMAIGSFLAFLVRFLVSRGLELVRFNRLCDKIGISEFIRKGQLNYTPSRLAGVICFWATLIFSIFIIADIARVTVMGPMLTRIADSMPKILTAGLIFLVGYMLTIFFANFFGTIANNAAFPHSGLLTRIIKFVGIILVTMIALENLDINSKIIGYTFLILLGAVAFGTALAFGLGSKDIARSIMERIIRNLQERSRKNTDNIDLEG